MKKPESVGEKRVSRSVDRKHNFCFALIIHPCRCLGVYVLVVPKPVFNIRKWDSVALIVRTSCPILYIYKTHTEESMVSCPFPEKRIYAKPALWSS